MLRSCERLTNLPALRKIGFQANRRLLRVQQLSHDPITGITALHNVTEPGLQSACSLISCDLVPHGRLVLQGAHSHRVPSRSCQPDPRSASARRSRAPTDRPTWASRFVGAVVTPTNHHRAPRIASPVTTAPAVIGTHDGVQHHRPRSGVTCLRWMCRSLDGSAAVAAGGSGLDAEWVRAAGPVFGRVDVDGSGGPDLWVSSLELGRGVAADSFIGSFTGAGRQPRYRAPGESAPASGSSPASATPLGRSLVRRRAQSRPAGG